jgi:iron complex outermembrane receptor protein
MLLFASLASFGQANVNGTIKDQISGQAIPFVVVTVDDSNTGASSDLTGQFSLNLSTGNHDLHFHLLGYRDTSISIRAEGSLLSLTIVLQTSDMETAPVVISSSRSEQSITDVPVSIEILRPRYIENSIQPTLETAIEQVPGVTVIDGQANIRGGSGFSYGAGTRVLVLVDDLPMLAGDANDVKWSFIPVENTEQVEVLKGASSALYGSSALNGVINLRTKFAGEKPSTKIIAFGSVYDTPDNDIMKWWRGNRSTGAISVSHSRKIKNFDLVAGGQYFNDAGYRQAETEERVRGNFNVRYHFQKIKGLTAGLAVNAQRAEGGSFLIWTDHLQGALIPAGGAGEGSTLSRYITKRITIDPSIIYAKARSSHKLRGRFFQTDNENNTDQGSQAETYYGEYLFMHWFSEYFKTTAGIAISNNKVQGDLYGKHLSSTQAAFAQIDGKWKMISYTLGYRIEKAEISGINHDAEQLLRGGINIKLLKATWLRSSYGQGFRFPSIAEKYIRTRVGNIVIYPNDSLITERGFSWEAGLRQMFTAGKWLGMIDAAYFITEYTDMMEFTFGAYGNPAIDPLFGLGFKSRNIGNTRISGIEVSASGNGMIGNCKQSLMTGITLIDPVQLDFVPARDTLTNTSKENVLKYRYRTMFKIDVETEYKKIYAGFSARYYSFMENIDKPFEAAIPGVKTFRDTHNSGDWIFDLRAGYNFSESLRIGFNIKNAGNREYATRPADLQAPRTFLFQIIYSK